MASALSTQTAEVTPETARRAWPRRLALGLALIALAVVVMFWPAGGGRVLLAGLGLCVAGRGLTLLGATAAYGPTRPVGIAAVVAGVVALLLAALSATATAWVLLVGVPVLLLGAALGLHARGGMARRGAQGLFVWTGLVIALLVASGLARGWHGAAGVATVVGALGVAVLGVPLLIGAARLRAVAALPSPAAPSGCGGCACGAGGCGAAD